MPEWQEKQKSKKFECFMFHNNETAETDDVRVSTVISDNKEECHVTQLPGSNDEKELTMMNNMHPKQNTPNAKRQAL
jgi:hypothetical protein